MQEAGVAGRRGARPCGAGHGDALPTMTTRGDAAHTAHVDRPDASHPAGKKESLFVPPAAERSGPLHAASADPLSPVDAARTAHAPSPQLSTLSMNTEGPSTPLSHKTSLLRNTETASASHARPYGPTLHTSRSMSSLVTPTRTGLPRRRRPRVSYVTSPTPNHQQEATPSPRARAASASSSTQRPATDTIDTDALLQACAQSAHGAEPLWPGSSLQSDMLHAIATKERLCLELREQLQNEETQLTALRNAWQRLAVRGAIKTAPPHRPAPRRSEVLQPQRTSVFSPSSIQARRTEQQLAPPPPARGQSPNSPTHASPTKSKESSWRARIPQQLTSLMDQVTHTHEEPVRNPAREVSQWLAAREQEEGGTPPTPHAGPEVPGSTQPPLAYTERHTLDADALPPSLPPKDGEGLGDRLMSGWSVLSKRFLETTSTLADPHAWSEGLAGPPSSRGSLPRDYMSDIPDLPTMEPPCSETAMPPMTLGTGASVLGLRSMAWHARQKDDELPDVPPQAPPVPPKAVEKMADPQATEEIAEAQHTSLTFAPDPTSPTTPAPASGAAGDEQMPTKACPAPSASHDGCISGAEAHPAHHPVSTMDSGEGARLPTDASANVSLASPEAGEHSLAPAAHSEPHEDAPAEATQAEQTSEPAQGAAPAQGPMDADRSSGTEAADVPACYRGDKQAGRASSADPSVPENAPEADTPARSTPPGERNATYEEQ